MQSVRMLHRTVVTVSHHEGFPVDRCCVCCRLQTALSSGLLAPNFVPRSGKRTSQRYFVHVLLVSLMRIGKYGAFVIYRRSAAFFV